MSQLSLLLQGLPGKQAEEEEVAELIQSSMRKACAHLFHQTWSADTCPKARTPPKKHFWLPCHKTLPHLLLEKHGANGKPTLCVDGKDWKKRRFLIQQKQMRKCILMLHQQFHQCLCFCALQLCFLFFLLVDPTFKEDGRTTDLQRQAREMLNFRKGAKCGEYQCRNVPLQEEVACLLIM